MESCIDVAEPPVAYTLAHWNTHIFQIEYAFTEILSAGNINICAQNMCQASRYHTLL